MNIKYIFIGFLILFLGIFLADRGSFINGELNIIVSYIVAFITITVFGIFMCLGFKK